MKQTEYKIWRRIIEANPKEYIYIYIYIHILNIVPIFSKKQEKRFRNWNCLWSC